jgi:hypothetical protein
MHFCSARRAPVLLFALAAAAQALAARPAAAVSRRLDLATLTAHAGTIVAGRIAAIRTGSHPRYHHIGALHVTIKVSETIKGAPKDRLTFMQFAGGMPTTDGAGSVSMSPSLPEMPSYRVGEEVVLFLYKPSSVGFTSPVGGSQGKFLIQRPQGKPAVVVSSSGNQSLAVRGELPSHLTPAQQALLRHPGASLDYKTFTAVVKALVKNATGAKAGPETHQRPSLRP